MKQKQKIPRSLKRNFFMESARREAKMGKYDDHEKMLSVTAESQKKNLK